MRLSITTPTAVALDIGGVVSVRAEDASGRFGILEGHADFLTALSVCVIRWTDDHGSEHFCAARHGMLAVRDGADVSIATREALIGDDLDHLEGVVLAEFRQAAEAEAAARAESQELQVTVVREIIRYLRPLRQGVFGGSP